MRHALRANNRRNNAATRGERREPCQNMHWPRPSLWRDFQGINGLKIQGFFETSKVLWNVLAYFKEKFERQFRITAKWRFHPCSCSLFTYFSDLNPFNSGFSIFIPEDLFPMQNNQISSPGKKSGPIGPRVSVKFYPSGAAVIDIDHYRRLYKNNSIKVHVNIINLMKLIEETHNFTTRWKKILKCKNMSNQKIIYR